MKGMNWDTIKLFLAVQRLGSARAVALQEGVSASTVTRRLTDLEAQLKVKLFNRHSAGFELTDFGEELLSVAEKMEADAFDIERKLLAKNDEMSGSVRITIPVHFMTEPFMQAAAGLSALYPALDLEVIPSWEAFSLAKGEADIALRLMFKGRLPADDLVGVKVADIHCANYVAQSYLDARDIRLGDLLNDSVAAKCNFIGWGEGTAYPDWVKASALPRMPAKHSLADPLMQLYAAKAGLGVAMLPCFLCDGEPELLRIPAANAEQERWHRFDVWLLSHPDLRDTPRFKAVRQYLREYFAKSQGIWQGD